MTRDQKIRLIYLDHSATTPVREEVVEVMLPYFSNEFANASSIHMPGQRARKAVEKARQSTAGVIGTDSIRRWKICVSCLRKESKKELNTCS